MRTKIFGPPGTGKTTRLLEIVRECLEKYNAAPEEIGYFAFTKKAAVEAKERGEALFPNKKIEYRTLHSLAYEKIGAPQVMSSAQYRKFSEDCGIGFNVYGEIESDYDMQSKIDQDHLKLINLARVKTIDVEKLVYDLNLPIWIPEIKKVETEYFNWKKKNSKLDYTDLIETYINKKIKTNFRFIFIDEAQDLCPLYWKMVALLEQNCEHSYIAGDDDQALYSFNGADVNHFIETPCDNQIILSQSYRVPRVVHKNYSTPILDQISRRIKKEYKPRDFEGDVRHHANYDSIDFSKGQFMVLCRNNVFLKPLKQYFIDRGYYFQFKGEICIANLYHRLIGLWDLLHKGGRVTINEAKFVYEHISSNVGCKHGVKTKFNDPTLDPAHTFDLKELIDGYGLWVANKPWYVAFDTMSDDHIGYMKRVLETEKDIGKNARIKISTIHGAKGGEADNVVFLKDITQRVRKNSLHFDIDNEQRCKYVGVTRTKETLHIVEPYTRNGYQLP